MREGVEGLNPSTFLHGQGRHLIDDFRAPGLTGFYRTFVCGNRLDGRFFHRGFLRTEGGRKQG